MTEVGLGSAVSRPQRYLSHVTSKHVEDLFIFVPDSGKCSCFDN